MVRHASRRGHDPLHLDLQAVLNGGPHYKFSEAVSLFVGCDTQEEIDEAWAKLTALGRMLGDKDPARSHRVMTAMLQMNKLDLKRLQQAYDGE